VTGQHERITDLSAALGMIPSWYPTGILKSYAARLDLIWISTQEGQKLLRISSDQRPISSDAFTAAFTEAAFLADSSPEVEKAVSWSVTSFLQYYRLVLPDLACVGNNLVLVSPSVTAESGVLD